MNIKIQVIDTHTGIYSYGSINEPNIKKGLEIDHALKTFGIDYGNVDWRDDIILLSSTIMIGLVKETTKIAIIIICE